MKLPMFASLDGLTELGSRNGVDMRPTLLRVLTDLYVQRLTHTAEEDRHYTELALRLIEAVDVPTRAAVALRLAAHPAPPGHVVVRLARDLPEVAGPLQTHPLVLAARVVVSESPKVVVEAVSSAPPAATEAPGKDTRADHEPLAISSEVFTLDITVASELNELFFAADADERSLILLNLDVLAPLSAGETRISRDPHACQRLEAAGLAHNGDEFVQHLARTLHIPHGQALRIVRDPLGEPIVVAAKVLKMPADMLQRILLFLNPAVGQSVERVHALAALYDEMTVQAAEHVLALWQKLRVSERAMAAHRTMLWSEETRTRARPQATAQRAPTPGRSAAERRNAS